MVVQITETTNYRGSTVYIFVDIFASLRRTSYDPHHNRFEEMIILDLKRHSENEIRDRLTKMDYEPQHVAISLSGNFLNVPFKKRNAA